MLLALKIKSKNGQHVVNVNQDTTLKSLMEQIRDLTQIPLNLLNLKIGFPPKQLDISKDQDTLNDSGIKNGDTLIAEEKQMSQEEKEAIERQKRLEEDEKLAQQLAGNIQDPTQAKGVLLKRVVPADNSCLFTSVGFVLTGS
jgi:ubiquitin thioesterase OTU1